MEERKKNILFVSVINFFKGIVFGMVNIVPGVSGGTIAVVMGIYDGIISSVNTAFKGKKQFAAAVIYLLPIALGAVIGILALATLLSYCLEKFSLPTNLFFAGLIIGTVPNLIFIVYPGLKKKNSASAKETGERPASGKRGSAGFKAWHILPFLIAAALVASLAFVTPAEKDIAGFGGWHYVLLPLAGFGAAVIMMIPGVSGSFFLKLIGLYGIIVGASSVTGFNIAVIGLFGIGAVIGIIAAAKIIDFLFKHFKTVTYLAVLGLVTGCIASIFIWKDTYSTGTGIWGIVTGIVLALAGVACALLLGYSPKGRDLGEKLPESAGKEENSQPGKAEAE